MKAISGKVIKVHNAAGQVVAGVRGDVLQKRITRRGMLTRPLAIAFDVVVLDQAEARGAERIEVLNSDTGITYQCTMADFRTGAFPLDQGYGAQLALPLTRWHIAGEKPTRAPEPARQLDLWRRHG